MGSQIPAGLRTANKNQIIDDFSSVMQSQIPGRRNNNIIDDFSSMNTASVYINLLEDSNADSKNKSNSKINYTSAKVLASESSTPIPSSKMISRDKVLNKSKASISSKYSKASNRSLFKKQPDEVS